ncbi:hypothetical protein HMPREF3172_04610 [Brevibacterium sp. HMSC08F02]|nr:hypothetical protein HMPREF3172_04610 [Brevibacterium sp. HMSC08F02]
MYEVSLPRAGDLPVMTGSARYEVPLLRAGGVLGGVYEVPLLRAPTFSWGPEAEIPECRFRMLRVMNATVG